MSSAFRSSPQPSDASLETAASLEEGGQKGRGFGGLLATAELFAIGWESISGLLFATAVSPAVVARPWPTLVFTASLGLSALLSPKIARGGRGAFFSLDATRAIAWALALLPVVELTGRGALLGAGAFGLMASGVRRALYRNARDRETGPSQFRSFGDAGMLCASPSTRIFLAAASIASCETPAGSPSVR